jgi:hypothetical protein
MPYPAFKITVTKYFQEEGEIGRQWQRTGKKDEKGDDVYDYSPSVRGLKEVSKTVFESYVEHEIDVPAIQRIVNRKPKEVPMK